MNLVVLRPKVVVNAGIARQVDVNSVQLKPEQGGIALAS